MLKCIETMLRFLAVLPPYHVNSFSNLNGRLLNALGGLCAQDREGRLWAAPLRSECIDSTTLVPSSPLRSLFLSLLLPLGLFSPSQYRARLGY